VNAELRNLLRQAGIPEANASDSWSRALMVHIHGLLPVPANSRAAPGEQGFHLLLIDGKGRVVHRVKCRGKADEGFRRECEALVLLGKDQNVGDIMPRVKVATSPRLRIHVSAELPGESFDSILRRQDAKEWQKAASEILSIVHRIGRRSTEVLPWLRDIGPSVRLLDALEPRLQQLRSDGMAGDLVRAIRRAIGDIEVPCHAQHGDLWPGNVISRGTEGWWVIDYERFGDVRFPLYDQFLLVWTSGQIARRYGRTWRRFLRTPLKANLWENACQQLLRCEAQRYDLSDDQVAALLLAALVELTAHRMRPGAPTAYSRGLRVQLDQLAQGLDSGLALTTFTPRLASLGH
jgi:hypothetical protein